MSPNQLHKDVMTLDMLDAKIKLCEEAERQRRLAAREKQATRFGNNTLRRVVSMEETFGDNSSIVLGSE